MTLGYGINLPEIASFAPAAQTSVLSTAKDLAQIAQAGITVIAVLVGGYWAYSRFVRGRLGRPRANLTHQITHLNLGEGKVLLRVTVMVENLGSVLLRLGQEIVRIQQVSPLPAYVASDISEGRDPVKSGQSEVEWSGIVSRQRDLSEIPIQLEPGESDEIIYDFIVESYIQTVKIYTHYSSVNELRQMMPFKKKRDPLGWKRASIYELRHIENVADAPLGGTPLMKTEPTMMNLEGTVEERPTVPDPRPTPPSPSPAPIIPDRILPGSEPGPGIRQPPEPNPPPQEPPPSPRKD